MIFRVFLYKCFNSICVDVCILKECGEFNLDIRELEIEKFDVIELSDKKDW